MKKVSTAAAKATKNFSQPKLTIGLDLGDRSSWYCLLDEVGEVRLEQKLSTTPKAMREVFGSMPRCRIGLETGMHSPWVSRVLSELGHEVIVAHARNVRLIGESRKKDDRLDARTLARLARIDPQLLCPVKHRSAHDCVYGLAHLRLEMEERSTNRWQHRLKREHPTCTRAKHNRSSRVRMEGWRQWRLDGKNILTNEKSCSGRSLQFTQPRFNIEQAAIDSF